MITGQRAADGAVSAGGSTAVIGLPLIRQQANELVREDLRGRAVDVAPSPIAILIAASVCV